MAIWKYAAAFATMSVPAATSAQDSFPTPDYTFEMGVYGAEAAVMDAARGGDGSRNASRPRSRTGAKSASNAKARRQCANARAQAKGGMRDPRLTRLLSICDRAGY